MNISVLGDLLSNTSVTMEAEDVRMVVTSYLMFKIGNFPVVINVEATKWYNKLHVRLRCLQTERK